MQDPQIPRVTATQDHNSNHKDPVSTTTLFVIGFVVILSLKIVLAAVLDLYSDEAFYWLESNYPALAYSDLPFMTAALISLGSSLVPGSTLAVRLVFIILGSLIPLLVLWIARPITGIRQAWESALLCLCLPLGAFLGLLAVPDVPLIFLGLLSVGFFERAIRSDEAKYWLATGLVAALGLSTHYRFALYPLAAGLFLVFARSQHHHWKNPRFWTAAVIMSLGLIPILTFNLTNQLSSATFYFVDRHPWEFQAQGLLHLFKQAALVTPPLYLLFIVTLWQSLQRARNGDSQAGLLASFATVNLAVYLVLAPWTDSTSTSIHWPLSGYFPLLVYVPATLRQFYHWLTTRYQAATARKLSLSIPIIGFLGSLVALFGVGSQGFQGVLQPLIGTQILSNKMAGWKEFAQHTEGLIASEFSAGAPAVITDNYYTSAQVQFANLSPINYSTDNAKAVRDGRLEQFVLWQRDESALINSNGQAALFITEDSTLTIPDKVAVLETFCSHVSSLKFINQLVLFEGDKQFSFYSADQLIAPGSSNSALAGHNCPYPSQAWIDQPVENDIISGPLAIRGWAYNEDIGVERLELKVNDEIVGQFTYGLDRPDVVEVRNINTDPNLPGLGFEMIIDSSELMNGRTTISIDITNRVGEKQNYGRREIIIRN